jgi:predicted nicotinamide N-methyase
LLREFRGEWQLKTMAALNTGVPELTAEEHLLGRLELTSFKVTHQHPEPLWAKLLQRDLECLADCSDGALARAVPLLVDLLALPASHPLCKLVLREAARATERPEGARAFGHTLWGARRLVKLAGSLALDDESRRLVDVVIEQTSRGGAVDMLSGRVAFEHVHREDMYPPTRLSFLRPRAPPEALSAARSLPLDGSATAGALELDGELVRACLEPPMAARSPGADREPARLQEEEEEQEQAGGEMAIGEKGTREAAHEKATGEEAAKEASEDQVLTLYLHNPSRRERFGSEIPSKIWPASVLLAQLLWQRPQLVRAQRVLELGAGMGLVGLAAMRCEAQTVLMTDLDAKALAHVRTNIARNAPPPPPRASASIAASIAPSIAPLIALSIAPASSARAGTAPLDWAERGRVEPAPLDRAERGRVEAAHLDWADPPPLDGDDDDDGAATQAAEGGGDGGSSGGSARSPARQVLSHGADLILAADIVNAPGLSELVYAMLLRYLARSGSFLMVCPKPSHRHTVETLRSLLLDSQEFECTVSDVPAWLVDAARRVAADGGDMEPAEFEVIRYELYHARWRSR